MTTLGLGSVPALWGVVWWLRAWPQGHSIKSRGSPVYKQQVSSGNAGICVPRPLPPGARGLLEY